MSERTWPTPSAPSPTAAAAARRLGFDAVELHGAHGYLIDQFFWTGPTCEDDKYGVGSIAGRARFARDICRGGPRCSRAGFPISLRVSQWKQQGLWREACRDANEMENWLRPLVDAGVDVLHCSQRRFWEPEFPEIDGSNGLNLAGWAKKLTGAATISVGSVGLSVTFLQPSVVRHRQASRLIG